MGREAWDDKGGLIKKGAVETTERDQDHVPEVKVLTTSGMLAVPTTAETKEQDARYETEESPDVDEEVEENEPLSQEGLSDAGYGVSEKSQEEEEEQRENSGWKRDASWMGGALSLMRGGASQRDVRVTPRAQRGEMHAGNVVIGDTAFEVARCVVIVLAEWFRR